MPLRSGLMTLAAALLGSTIFAAAPAAAAPLGPVTAPLGFDQSRYDPATSVADWRCRGWGCRYGHRRGWRRNRIGAGDVLIGAAIIGGIAAIASANNNRVRQRDVVIVDRDVRDRDWDRREPRRYDDRRDPLRSTGASGLDNAVDQCLTRIERDVRVDTVDNVERTAAGWQVSGVLFNGAPFECRIGNGGQIDEIDYGGGFSFAPSSTTAPGTDSQWDDERYVAARSAVGGTVQPYLGGEEVVDQAPQARLRQTTGTPLPAYPGGPIPGETIPDTIDGDL